MVMKLRYMIMALVVLSGASLFICLSYFFPSDMLDWKYDNWKVLIICRFPRMVSILVAAGSMSIIGLIMQQLSNNKFVSPTTTGTMDYARDGILVSLGIFSTAGAMPTI